MKRTTCDEDNGRVMLLSVHAVRKELGLATVVNDEVGASVSPSAGGLQ